VKISPFRGFLKLVHGKNKNMKALLCLLGKAMATGGFLGYVCFTQSIQTGSAQEITLPLRQLHASVQ
jgi:hypothetical protein